MNFLYKIYSGYDGFQPKNIPSRMIDGRYLDLGWERYLDVVDKGDEVWIYYFGPHHFLPGVYAKGRVTSINQADKQIRLRVYSYKITSPLTDDQTTQRIALLVRARGRQVFYLPADWEKVSDCSVFGSAQSCTQRRCEWCATWQGFERIYEDTIHAPPRLSGRIETLIAAYWSIPSRCYLSRNVIKPSIRQVSQILKSFKTGNANLAYPFARGIFEAMNEWGIEADYDCIVPVPLSPDKAAAGEIHRTKLLAKELSELLGIPFRPLLELKNPISKRRMLSAGYTYAQFENAYRQSIQVMSGSTPKKVLVVDDVCTHGGTLGVITDVLVAKHPGVEITAAVATQMIVKSAIVRESSIKI